MRPCRATRAGTQAPPLPTSIIFFHASRTNKITIYAQSIQTTSTVPYVIHPNGINHPHAIQPNEIVGAAPVCPPERPRSGVSMPKIHALCAGNLTTDAPLWGDAGGHTGTAPTNLHHIFPRNPTQTKYHLHAICPNDINCPRAIHPSKMRRGGACVPARTSAQRRFHTKKYTHCARG